MNVKEATFMKNPFLLIGFILTITIFLLAGNIKTGAEVNNKKTPFDKGKDINQETLIKTQEEKIKQLEGQIKEQQKEIEKLQKQISDQNKENPVEMALRKSWNCCPNRIIEIKNSLVKIYFGGIYDIIYFFDNDAIQFAYDDLMVFLKKTGFKTGTIEYYSAPEKKLFSISGSLDDAKTQKFY
jgi:hypothetical protein